MNYAIISQTILPNSKQLKIDMVDKQAKRTTRSNLPKGPKTTGTVTEDNLSG
jgi:hypothetical protein